MSTLCGPALPVAAVQTLGLQVAVVDAAVCGHEHVGQTVGGVCPVHQSEGQRRARASLEAVSVGLQEGDGVPVTAPPQPPAVPGQVVGGGARPRVTAAPRTAAHLRRDDVAVRGGLLHGQARAAACGRGCSGGRVGGGHH